MVSLLIHEHGISCIHIISSGDILYFSEYKSNTSFVGFTPKYFILLFYLFIFCLLRAAPTACGSSQAWAWIGAAAAGLHHGHSNTRPLTHWMRPGIEPTSSWILVGSVTAEPWWELQYFIIFDATINGIASLILFLNCLLLVYGHTFMWSL